MIHMNLDSYVDSSSNESESVILDSIESDSLESRFLDSHESMNP